MGWNSWNVLGCDLLNEENIKKQTDALISNGLDKLGFKYILIDDCWQDMERDAEQHLKADVEKFPNGMKALADYVHKKGLKIGIYSSAGAKTCAGRPGSLGFEQEDAATFASWGIDYLKYDNCYNTRGVPAIDRYTQMGRAINETGRDIFYSICNWGNEDVTSWAPAIAQSWRTTIDIQLGNTTDSMKNGFQKIAATFKRNAASYEVAGPGGWNDPDMMTIGYMNLGPEEMHTHLALWALSKAPLILSCDLTQIGPDTDKTTVAYLLKNNPDLLSISQDQVGLQARILENSNQPDVETVYTVSTIDGMAYAILLLVNWGEHAVASDLSFDFKDLGISSSPGDPCTVYDYHQGKELTGLRGGVNQLPTNGMQTHASYMFRIKCNPFGG